MATMTTTRLATTRVEFDDAMDVDDASADRTTEEIIVAAYRRDADAVASALRRCSPATTADMSLSRAKAVSLLGEDVYLGSHSWSTQEDFPVMYFAGARPSRPRPGRARASPAPARTREIRATSRHAFLAFSRES
jgi:hypothetical protein